FFTTLFSGAIFKENSLPPLLQRMQAQPFRWISGDAELTLPPPSGATDLLIQAAPLNDNIDVEIRVAGEKVQVLNLRTAVQDYAIPLPAAAIENTHGGPLRVTFHSTAYRPTDLTSGRSPDNRLLAFALLRLQYSSSGAFGLEVSNPAIFTRGVYELERDGIGPFRWLSGDAEFNLPPPSPGAPSLLIQAAAIQNNLDVEVQVAGETVQALKLTTDVREYAIPLPTAAVETGRSGQPLHITFHSADFSRSELTSGRALDARRLSFALRQLRYSRSGALGTSRVGTLEVNNPSIFSHGA